MSFPFIKYEVFTEDLAKKIHNLDTDTLKALLSNTAPTVSSDVDSGDTTEISAGFGYTAGGEDAQNAVSRSGSTTSVTGVDIVWTASGGSIGPFRYVILYNSTADRLIGYWDYGSSITLLDGQTFTADFGTSLFTIDIA